MSHPDTNEIIQEGTEWNGHVFDIPTNIESTNVDDIISNLKCENAYFRGMVKAYEKFLTEKGYIDNGDMEHSTRFHK